MKKIFGKAYIYICLLLMYLPIIILFIFSFNSVNVISLNAKPEFTLDLYKLLFDFTDTKSKEIWTSVLNTLKIAVSAAACSTVIGTLGAIGIFYSRKKVKNILNGVANISIVNAEIVTALSLRILYNLLNIKLSFLTLLIGHTVLTIPFVVLNVIPKLEQMDKNEYEAALDLGATNFQALYKVMIPEIIPGIISGFLLSITLSLDDYIITAFTTETTFDTLSTYVYKSMVKKAVPLQFRPLTTIIFAVIIVGVIVYGAITKNSKKTKHRVNN